MDELPFCYDGEDSGLYQYCRECDDDITLAMGIDDGLCRQCQEDLE